MNTRRIIRRTAAVVLGLSLGWLAAGLEASEPHHTEPAPHGNVAPDTVPHGESHGEHHGTAADHLAVGEHDAPFYQNVLLTAAGLFIAAIALGAPAEKLRGPLPPDPADAHDDHHH